MRLEKSDKSLLKGKRSQYTYWPSPPGCSILFSADTVMESHDQGREAQLSERRCTRLSEGLVLEMHRGKGMAGRNNSAIYESEELHKEDVYRSLEKMTSNSRRAAEDEDRQVKAGAYEDHAAFMAYSKRNEAYRKWNENDKLVRAVWEKPYFAHISAYLDDDPEPEHFFLSDSEFLAEAIPIKNDGLLIPFKQDPKRPISRVLFHCYQSRNLDSATYAVPESEQISFTPELICDDEIKNRELISANQIFPSVQESIDADELLEDRLNENRSDPQLRNIISTLQRQQFDIISASTDEAFVVQGCAGSGKSQVLLHRLFYLRDELSQRGWEQVLLLTPTALFRTFA